MNDWAWTVLWVGIAMAGAGAIIGGLAVYKDPSVECLKAGGAWVPYDGRPSGYCTTRKP